MRNRQIGRPGYRFAARPSQIARPFTMPARHSAVLPFPSASRTVAEVDWLRECQQATEHARAYELNAAVRALAAIVREIDAKADAALLVRVEGCDELAVFEVYRRGGGTATELVDDADTPRTDLADEIAATIRVRDAEASMWLARRESGEGWLLDVDGALGGPSPIAEAFAA